MKLKLFSLTLLTLMLGFHPAFAQAISPDHRWEIRMVINLNSGPLGPSFSTSVIRLSDKTEQVLEEGNYDSEPGPQLEDLAAVRWTEDSRAFFIPDRGRRYKGFHVCALEKERWNEISLAHVRTGEEQAIWDQARGDDRYELEYAKAWVHHNILKWILVPVTHLGGTEAVFYYRLVKDTKGMTFEFVSGEIEPAIY